MVSGPMCSMILADQGAEVIKVEPVIGDQVRHMATPHNGVNAPFYSVNRGKKSLAIDLKSKEGKEILLKLAEDADVSCKILDQAPLIEWVLAKKSFEN